MSDEADTQNSGLVRGVPFKSGEDARRNAGGRPAAIKDVALAARQHTQEALERLVFWMRSDNAKASPAACKELLARGWGTSPIKIAISGNLGLMDDATLERAIAGELSHFFAERSTGRAALDAPGETETENQGGPDGVVH